MVLSPRCKSSSLVKKYLAVLPNTILKLFLRVIQASMIILFLSIFLNFKTPLNYDNKGNMYLQQVWLKLNWISYITTDHFFKYRWYCSPFHPFQYYLGKKEYPFGSFSSFSILFRNLHPFHPFHPFQYY